MKISENWLREWVNPPIDTDELVSQLTMAGLEVDSVEPAGQSIAGVVVAEIVEVAAHPDADKLRVCQVNLGSEQVQIVCGAPNAVVGLKAPCATVGSVLPGDMRIKKAKLRGVESSGMLCGADELGFDLPGDGLWELPASALVGESLADWLQLDDQVIEVDLTPNRADCLSVRGVARETALLNNQAAQSPAIKPVEATIDHPVPIELLAPQACPLYIGRVIRGVDLSAESPLWMQERLRRAGMRSIDAVVDVTNYVMLELGQPLHAFDLAQIDGGIRVREAEQGEKLTLLDGKELILDDDCLVIADHAKPLALAGIMGGEHSGISANTRDIMLESAFFAPSAITGRARRFGLHTESSHRFERGVDPQLAKQAVERATRLFLDICGGQAGPVCKAIEEGALPIASHIHMRRKRCLGLIGMEISDERIVQVLEGIGCEVTDQDDGWTAVPPSWRFDLALEVDLIEEVARVVGYENIPEVRQQAAVVPGLAPENRSGSRELADHLVSRGFREAVTYSFVAPELAGLVAGEKEQVQVTNPISADLSVMRPSLVPGLLAAARRNLDRQEARVMLFETGLRFSGGDGFGQRAELALVMCGNRQPESWANSTNAVDYFAVRAELELLMAAAGLDYQLVADAQSDLYHPGQSARLLVDGKQVGRLGMLHPAAATSLQIESAVACLEVNLKLLEQRSIPAFEPLSKYPAVRRDIALLVDRDLSGAELLESIHEAGSDALKQVRIFDIYTGQGIDSNKKSVALGLTFRATSRTLKDEEIGAEVVTIVEQLSQRHGAIQR